mmetsp:Transcript_33413/g.68218  ORF Transcript_33413/g.68218 Transcript_33413/m.68218 type:complete len:81 (+) Transcript_33413:1133-1375(+)
MTNYAITKLAVANTILLPFFGAFIIREKRCLENKHRTLKTNTELSWPVPKPPQKIMKKIFVHPSYRPIKRLQATSRLLTS